MQKNVQFNLDLLTRPKSHSRRAGLVVNIYDFSSISSSFFSFFFFLLQFERLKIFTFIFITFFSSQQIFFNVFFYAFSVRLLNFLLQMSVVLLLHRKWSRFWENTKTICFSDVSRLLWFKFSVFWWKNHTVGFGKIYFLQRLFFLNNGGCV